MYMYCRMKDVHSFEEDFSCNPVGILYPSCMISSAPVRLCNVPYDKCQ
jgi:hypothetical protein